MPSLRDQGVHDHQMTDVLDTLFQKIFAKKEGDLVGIVADVVELIRENADYFCGEALANTLVTLAEANPYKLSEVTSIFDQIISATNDIDVEDDTYGNRAFPFFFRLHLYEMVYDQLYESDTDKPFRTQVEPSNTVLTAALLAGYCWKYKFITVSNVCTAFTAEALAVPRYKEETGRGEVMGIGACLQLVTVGAVVKYEVLGPEADIRKMEGYVKGLQDRNVIKASRGAELLSRTLELARKDFSETISSSEAWSILFPKAS